MPYRRCFALLLSLLMTACMTPPADLDLALIRPTAAHKYVVGIRPMTEVIPLNKVHQWEVSVRSATGAAVLDAQIEVDGGMPQHGHGLPTHPRVTAALDDGRYVIDGMKFSMTGWWEIKLQLTTAAGSDTVTFNTVVELPTAVNKQQAKWTQSERAMLASLQLDQLPALPNDASNAYADSPLAVSLGEQLFNDTRLSRNGQVACASCHDPARYFQDDRPVGIGVGMGSRRAMPIADAAYSSWLFWDGRKDSLWAQALGPLEDAVEHAGNRLQYVRLISEHYREPYQQLFGALPDLSGLPLNASPLGTVAEQQAWADIAAEKRVAVSRAFANIGKAIAAYERTVHHSESRLDHYLEALATGDSNTAQSALNEHEVNGLRLFIGKGQCISCHNGPLFTDQQFHNTGVPLREVKPVMQGRATALDKVLGDEFNCLGSFSDARPEQCEALRFIEAYDATLEGAYKTPGLRNVAQRPPYMHAGQFQSLEAVVAHYVAAPTAAIGASELSAVNRHGARDPIRLSASEQAEVVAFLRTL